MDRYLRSIRLIAGVKEFTYPDFTIYFRVNFDEEEDANDARIEIYNLSRDSESMISKDTPIILSAGYQGDMGTIFEGAVDDKSTDRQQADKIATIEATDRELFKGVTINKTYKEGSRSSQIIRDILTQTGFELGDLDLPEEKTYTRGKSFDTNAKNALSQLARDSGAKLHYTKGSIYIRPRDKGDNLGAYLDKDTGLIDIPERLEDDEDTGYNIKCFLNYLITTDVMVKVKSKTANGIYRARKGQHICDRDRFITTIEGVE